jgi:hypothetical protein
VLVAGKTHKPGASSAPADLPSPGQGATPAGWYVATTRIGLAIFIIIIANSHS